MFCAALLHADRPSVVDGLFAAQASVCSILAHTGWLHDSACVFLQADEWLAPGMGARFGPFSECAKQHVAVKPQKGQLLSKNM